MREIKLLAVHPDEWERDFAKNAHLAVFSENYGERDNVDAAIIGTIDGEIAAYSTAYHLGDGAVHLVYGGVVKKFRGSPEVLQMYRMLIEAYLAIAPSIRTYVHQKNRNYLTLALRQGFLVTGIRSFKGDILLELTLDREEK